MRGGRQARSGATPLLHSAHSLGSMHSYELQAPQSEPRKFSWMLVSREGVTPPGSSWALGSFCFFRDVFL